MKAFKPMSKAQQERIAKSAGVPVQAGVNYLNGIRVPVTPAMRALIKVNNVKG